MDFQDTCGPDEHLLETWTETDHQLRTKTSRWLAHLSFFISFFFPQTLKYFRISNRFLSRDCWVSNQRDQPTPPGLQLRGDRNAFGLVCGEETGGVFFFSPTGTSDLKELIYTERSRWSVLDVRSSFFTVKAKPGGEDRRRWRREATYPCESVYW